MKINLKRFLQRILLEIMKKIILGTSDAWSMSSSPHRPSDPAYYIEDCRIFRQCSGLDKIIRCKSSLAFKFKK